MNQTAFLPHFNFTLRRDSSSKPFLVTCSISEDTTKFHSAQRRFTTTEDIVAALTKTGISEDRHRDALRALVDHQESSFEISQNEAQKLGILQTDSTE